MGRLDHDVLATLPNGRLRFVALLSPTKEAVYSEPAAMRFEQEEFIEEKQAIRDKAENSSIFTLRLA